MNPDVMTPEPAAPEILERLALELEPVAPAVEIRSRLMTCLDGPERFAPFFADLSRLFDLPADVIKRLLARLDDARAWADGVPGVKLFDFAPGPGAAGAGAGFVRLTPGARFPRHRHLGDETTIVVEGILVDGGRPHGPGAVVHHEADSIHAYAAGPGRDLVVAVLHHGLGPADRDA